MSELPKGWISCSIFDLCTPKQWKTIPTDALLDNGYVVYGANGIIGKYDQYTHEQPTVMITCRGATCGNVHISQPFSYINGNAMALDNLCIVDLKYIFYYLKGYKFDRIISGSAQPQITQQGMKGLIVQLAPQAEQTRIVEKLDEVLAQVDTIKARLDGIPSILKRFRQSVLAAAVSGRLTEEWRGNAEFSSMELTLKDVTSMDIGNAFKSQEFTENGVPLLRGQNIEPGSLRWEDTKFFPEEKLEKYRHLYINEGDIILAMDRPIVAAGLKLARAKKIDLPCILVQRVARLQGNEFVSNDYLYLLLADSQFSNYLVPNQTGSDIPHISGKQIQAYSVSIPSIEEQKEIVRLVDQYFTFADTIEAQVKKAQARVDNLTQSILAKAFRGELVAQDPDDEPAEKLLERIAQARKEAEALAKAAKKVAKTK